jgi:hypothetical protein
MIAIGSSAELVFPADAAEQTITCAIVMTCSTTQERLRSADGQISCEVGLVGCRRTKKSRQRASLLP